MKTNEEIEDKIEYTYDAMIDLDNRRNQKEADKLAIKIETLEWVLGHKVVNQ